MSNGVDIVGVVTEDDVSAMISCEDKILKELTEVCKNIMVKREDRPDESLTNASENEKMSSGDTSMESLINVVNNGAYRILESRSNSSENLMVKSDDVFGETPSDASCRSTCLIGLGNISKSEKTSEGENLTDAGENVIYPRVGYAEGLTNASMDSEMDKCSTDAVGNVAMNSGDVPLESFTDIRESSINNGPIFGEGMRDANQNVSFVHADSSVSSKKDEIVECLTNTVANIIVSNIESDGTEEGTSFSSENNETSLEYQENSEYSFSQLEERKKPIEIKKPGKFVLSNTENGESSVLYEPNFYTEDEAWELFECLYDSTEWLDKSIVIHGIEYPQPRLVAWYGPLPYSYSGTMLEPAEMPECVLAIKRRVEDYLKGNNINVELNSVLLNLYRNNKDSVSWHSDDEITMGVCPTIASISLGETRKFEMRPKSNRHYEDEHDQYFVHLNNGSLIIMDGCMQEDWQHRVPKEYHDRDARINLTFRTVYKFENGSPYSNSRINNYKPVDREIPKNPSRIKIDLDEENFPPLSSVSDNINSRTAHKTYEKAECSKSKIEINTNKISGKESETNYPGSKSPSKINDRINNSEEQWTVETPPSNKTRIIDKINASEEEWVVRTPVGAKALFKTNDTVSTSQGELATKSLTSHRTFHKRDDVHEYVKKWYDDTANESKEELTIKSLSSNRAYREAVNKDRNSENTAVKQTLSNRAPPDSNYVMNTPEEEWDVSTPVRNNLEFGEINKSHYNCYEESTCISQLTPPESNNKSHKDWYDESCNSQILSESDEISQNQINQLREERHKKSFDHQQTSLESDKMYRSNEDNFEKAYRRQTPLESYKYYERRNVKSSYTKPNRFQSDKTNKYYEERVAKPFNKRNTPFETNRYHRYNERGATEPFHSKNISRREKNFKSDEVKSFESRNIERSIISNENIDGYEQRSDKNQNSNFKERRNESSNFAIHSMRKHLSDFRNEPGSNRSNGWRPNVKAEEFIPGKMKRLPSEMHSCPSSVDSSTFGHFSLIDLLNYDVDLMPSDELKNYASALKLRVLNSISEFEPSDTEELQVLCEITDGNQTDRNQKIICSRICALVNKTSKPQWNHTSNRTTPRYHQQAENHYLDRRFQDSP